METTAPSQETNKSKIVENRKNIFLLEHNVLNNKASAYLTRESILENRTLILKNYESAFQGNRQLLNSNSEAIFRNKAQIIKNAFLGVTDPLKLHYRDALLNKAKLEFLEHRSKLNVKVNSVNEELAQINSRLIEVNSEIMATNSEIITYNHGVILANREWIEKGVTGSSTANPESNLKLIDVNTSKIDEVSRRSDDNQTKNKIFSEAVKVSRSKIEANALTIHEKRIAIEANRDLILQNALQIAATIKSSN